jgi:hypothetical protein
MKKPVKRNGVVRWTFMTTSRRGNELPWSKAAAVPALSQRKCAHLWRLPEA